MEHTIDSTETDALIKRAQQINVDAEAAITESRLLIQEHRRLMRYKKSLTASQNGVHVGTVRLLGEEIQRKNIDHASHCAD